uniref:G-protein coupled receptors family 1 profile domain-containing protein n=2 Tax=Nothobranchius rachovii TaxID=451742 RepID=A0A1A8S099_9TELE
MSIAVCIGFLGAWTPYAAVAIWAALGDATRVPPAAFALAAIFAKSSTLYNPMVFLLCKPNFRECLYKDTTMLRQRIYRGSPQLQEHFGLNSQRNKDTDASTRFSNGQQENYGALLNCAENTALCQVPEPQKTACILTGSTSTEVTVSPLSANPQLNFL